MANGSTVTFKCNKCSVMWNILTLRRRKSSQFVNTVTKVLGIMEETVTFVFTSRMCIQACDLRTIENRDEENKTPAGTKSIEFFYATDSKSRRVCSNAKSEAITNLVVQ